MKKIKQIQTKDYIAEILKDYIISGKFEPNKEIYQEELTEVLGLSRTPIREALQVLEQDGFLERLPNRHMRVIPLTKEYIQMIFRMIGNMVAEIIMIISENNISTEELQKIYSEYVSALTAGNSKTAQQKEMEFLITLPETTKNQYLIQICSKILNGFPKYVIKNSAALSRENKDYLKNIILHINTHDIKSINSEINDYFNEMSVIITDKTKY